MEVTNNNSLFSAMKNGNTNTDIWGFSTEIWDFYGSKYDLDVQLKIMTLAKQFGKHAEELGMEKGMKRTALRMLGRKMDIHSVSDITDLSIEELKNLQASNDHQRIETQTKKSGKKPLALSTEIETLEENSTSSPKQDCSGKGGQCDCDFCRERSMIHPGFCDPADCWHCANEACNGRMELELNEANSMAYFFDCNPDTYGCELAEKLTP